MGDTVRNFRDAIALGRVWTNPNAGGSGRA